MWEKEARETTECYINECVGNEEFIVEASRTNVNKYDLIVVTASEEDARRLYLEGLKEGFDFIQMLGFIVTT